LWSIPARACRRFRCRSGKALDSCVRHSPCPVFPSGGAAAACRKFSVRGPVQRWWKIVCRDGCPKLTSWQLNTPASGQSWNLTEFCILLLQSLPRPVGSANQGIKGRRSRHQFSLRLLEGRWFYFVFGGEFRIIDPKVF
jgi:hypothetical protein